jgi:hypothetical protein
VSVAGCRAFEGSAEQGAEVFADVEGSAHVGIVGEAVALRWYRVGVFGACEAYILGQGRVIRKTYSRHIN